MPNMENTGIEIGGHHDLMVSKPVYWLTKRGPDQPLVEQHPKYGKVYNLGSPADFFEMTRRENLIVNMPHPRAKASTGFPDGVKETHFAQDTYEGAGYRWGMGIDGSEKRLCEYRCLGVFDEMTNWYVDRPIPLKHMQAISEARSDIGERGRPPYDAMYANGPVNYVKLDKLPTVDDMSPIINAMKTRRLLRQLGRGADLQLRGRGQRRQADDHRRGRMDLPAGVRRSGLGRRAEDRPPDHLDDRSAAVRQEALPDPVQRRREEVGAVCRLGRRNQRCVRPADQADAGNGHDRWSLETC